MSPDIRGKRRNPERDVHHISNVVINQYKMTEDTPRFLTEAQDKYRFANYQTK